MSSLSLNYSIQHGPSKTIPYRAIIIQLEGDLLEGSEFINDEKIAVLKAVLPDDLEEYVDCGEITEVRSFVINLTQALLSFYQKYPYEFKIVSEEKNKLVLALRYDLQSYIVLVVQFVFKLLRFILSGQQQITSEIKQAFYNDIENIIALTPKTIIATFMNMANQKNIPFYVIDDLNSNYSYGQGVNAKLFQYGSTEGDSNFGYHMQKDKIRTNAYLRLLGFPVSEQYVATNFQHCCSLVQEIGFPVVIKPHAEGRGTGVTANIRKMEDVAAAYKDAAEYSPENVLVEKYVPGDDHRINVYNGEVISVMRRRAGYVLGDGENTVEGLMKLENKRRIDLRAGGGRYLQQLELDDQMQRLLDDEGLTLDSVPEKGRKVYLISMANVSRGGAGKMLDVADMHPDNIKLSKDIAKLFRLNSVGLDFITQDISVSWQKEGAIIEVNAYPFVAAQIGEKMIDMEFADRNNGRIDSVLVISDDDGYARKTYEDHKKGYQNMGYTTNKFTETLGLKMDIEHHRLVLRLKSLYLNPTCDGVLVHMTADEVMSEGLPEDHFNQVIIDGRITELEKLEWIKNYAGEFKVVSA